ncbi:MAG TPA: glycosyltransferase family 4 protein [Beijerinckiaceae bacterium]|nr:glycosyltransferase family 4 protein [Beijerinckiaceae bacterium]
MTADAVGGVWQYALDLARGLADHEVETTLAVLGPAPAQDQMAAASSVPGLRLVPTGLPLDWTAATPVEVAGAGAAIAALAEDAAPDIVHLNSAALAAGARFPAQLVIACHSCVATWWNTVHDEPLPEDFMWRVKLVQQGYVAADALIAPTAAFATTTARTYGLKTPPTVVHNGRRVAVDRPCRPTFSSSFAFTAGRLWDEGKNLAAIDRAAARLAMPVLAAGPLAGPNGAEISLQHVRTLGRLSDDEVSRWLKPAPVFVSAAVYEPFGLAVLEAAQACCPLVLSDIPSFRELWDGAALFVPPDDDLAIAAAIERIVGDSALRAELGVAARERSCRYSVEAMAAGMAAIYRWLSPDAAASASYEKAIA